MKKFKEYLDKDLNEWIIPKTFMDYNENLHDAIMGMSKFLKKKISKEKEFQAFGSAVEKLYKIVDKVSKKIQGKDL